LETAFILKKIISKYGNFSLKFNLNNYCKDFINIDFRKNYIFSINLKSLNIYKNIYLIGLNLRLENALLNVKLKFLVDNFKIKIFNFGSCFNNNYFMYNFKNDILTFLKIFEGKSFLNNFILQNNLNFFIFGENFLSLFKNNFLNLKFFKYLKSSFDFSFLQNNVTNILNYDLNLNFYVNNFNEKTYKICENYNYENEILYTINVDSFFLINENIYLNMLKIYQGHHNFKNITFFNLILPTLTYFEKNQLHFINFFGFIQKSKNVFNLKNKNIHSDFDILCNIFSFLFKSKLNFTNFLENFKYNFLSLSNFLFNFEYNFYLFLSNNIQFNNLNLTKNYNLTNVYRSNQILKSSLVILSAYKEFKKKYSNFA